MNNRIWLLVIDYVKQEQIGEKQNLRVYSLLELSEWYEEPEYKYPDDHYTLAFNYNYIVIMN